MGDQINVGIFENKAVDVQINVQSAEIFFHMNHIQPVLNEVISHRCWCGAVEVDCVCRR